MRRLYLVRAYRRSYFGESQVTEPSRFLEDIPLHLVSNQGAASSHSSGSLRSSVSHRSSWGDDYNQDTHSSRETGRVFGSGKPPTSYPTTQRPTRPSPNTTPKLPTQKNNRDATPPAPSKLNSQQFNPGERVRHDKFGEGIILKSEMEQNTEFVEVQFQGKHGKKRLSMDFAKLEKI
jgi:DNA helicase-2/ATP-dependent DNA helicase PcrA